MGNWRTVNMQGSVSADDLPKLQSAVEYSILDYKNDHCLSYDPSTTSICGLNGWAKETISAIGNLSERDYDVEDVADTLRKLSTVAPSLNLVVHCGGDYESTECVATIVLNNGVVETKEPQIDRLMEISDSQMMGNLFKNLCKGRA